MASKGMTVCEKILYLHALGLSPPWLTRGEVVCVAPDWILSSEASWFAMDKMYTNIGRPRFKQNDRFWGHVVEPRINHLPKQRQFIERSERIAKEMELGENYQPANTTIMRTEYYRERVQPGMLVTGADSHTCSAARWQLEWALLISLYNLSLARRISKSLRLFESILSINLLGE
jgi:homoaconitate hydratase